MRNIILLFIFTFLTITYTHAQWIQQTSNTLVCINSVDFYNSYEGICVGYSGKILKTTNGGSNWEIQNSGTIWDLNTINYPDVTPPGEWAWAGGNHGTVLRTSNSGLSWEVLNLLTTFDFNSIQFIDINTGWVVGKAGEVYKTTNRGIDWTQQETGNTAEWHSVNFANANTGWVAGEAGLVYKTTNGGINWTHQETGNNADWYSANFRDENTGWVAGKAGLVYKTTDGGWSWTHQETGVNVDLHSIKFTDENTGWVVGNNGKILKSIDGGWSWTSQNSGTSKDLHRVDLLYTTPKGFGGFSQAMTGYVVGAEGTILKTTNGGVFVSSNNNSIPDKYVLHQNYPNPFNPSTTIVFDLPKSGFVSLKIYDILGREVAVLLNRKLKAGTYTGDWNADDYNSRIYFYRLKAGDFVETKKMVLLK